MITLYKYIEGVNPREGEELLMLKDNVGTRRSGDKLARSKFSLTMRRKFVPIGGGTI